MAISLGGPSIPLLVHAVASAHAMPVRTRQKWAILWAILLMGHPSIEDTANRYRTSLSPWHESCCLHKQASVLRDEYEARSADMGRGRGHCDGAVALGAAQPFGR